MGEPLLPQTVVVTKKYDLKIFKPLPWKRFFYFRPMNIPEFLIEGDKVAIVATAKRLESKLSDGIKILEEWGLEVVVGKSVYNCSGYFAGTDEEKIDDLQQVLNDPSIKAIIFARGGYGTTRILENLDFSSYIEQPKWLVGFSDLTSILLQSSAFEIPCVHGPVAVTLVRDQHSSNKLKELLFGSTSFEYPLIESSLTRIGDCSGKIVGGNLSLIYESIGAANEVKTDGNILFLEEVGEPKYSIDRMMNKLKRVGKLDKLSGAIIGSFSQISDSQSYFKESTEEILLNYLSALNIPIGMGLEAGHETRNYPLIIGMGCEVQVSADKLLIQYLR